MGDKTVGAKNRIFSHVDNQLQQKHSTSMDL